MANVLLVAGKGSKYKLENAKPAGFWVGLWHGLIAPIVFFGEPVQRRRLNLGDQQQGQTVRIRLPAWHRRVHKRRAPLRTTDITTENPGPMPGFFAP